MLISSREAFIGWEYPKPTSQIRILFNFSIGTCIISVYQWHLLSAGITGLGYTEKFSILPTMDRKFITLMGWPESRLCMGFLRFLHILTIRSWTGFSHHLPQPHLPPNHGVFVGGNFLSQMMSNSKPGALQQTVKSAMEKVWEIVEVWKSHWLVLGRLIMIVTWS